MNVITEENQLIDFELLGQEKEIRFYNHLTIYFVLNGELSVTVGESKSVLAEKQYLFVNAFRSHTLSMSENALVMGFFVNLELLSAYYDVSRLEFIGNSSDGDPSRYRTLRNLMENCIIYYYGKRTKDGRILLKLNSLYYQMAEQMIANFSVVKKEDFSASAKASDEVLLQNMMRYIQLNYQSPLKLEELADRFYLSTSYISRYFKKKLGVNFGKYLTEIRLDAAERELKNTDKPLTRIAMDCGFPNLAAFNKAFKDAYAVNPKVYRESLNDAAGEEDKPAPDSGMEYRLLDYFEKNKALPEEEYEVVETLDVDAASYTYLNKPWNKIINIGRIAMLLTTSVQKHVLLLRDELEFEYVRVWDLYDPELRLHAESETKKYNFSRLDNALDFLVENHLKPYIELGFKPDILLDAYESYTRFIERELVFEKAEDYGAFVRRLLVHFLNRYSMQEVSGWTFEMWCDPRVFPEGDPSLYFSYFEQAYQVVKEIVPLAKIGGDYDRTYGFIDFESFVMQWSKRRIQPDFLSIYCYPALVMEKERYGSYSSNYAKFFVNEYLSAQKEILLKYGMKMPVYTSEWNFTVVNYNVLNDSRFKGAYMMDTIMKTYTQTDAMGYWFGSDIFAEGEEASMLLNGRCGLITHQSICKPAFWGMKFMNRLEKYLLAQSEHAMVSRDEFDSYVVACHNFKPLDVQYYVQEEKNITIDAIPTLYRDKKHLILKVKIEGVKNGLYHVKTRRVNSQYGGVQDEWIRMGQVTFLNQRDINYIRHMSRPRITIAEQKVTNHTLYLTTSLEPQEIQCIHFFRYISESVD